MWRLGKSDTVPALTDLSLLAEFVGIWMNWSATLETQAKHGSHWLSLGVWRRFYLGDNISPGFCRMHRSLPEMYSRGQEVLSLIVSASLGSGTWQPPSCGLKGKKSSWSLERSGLTLSGSQGNSLRYVGRPCRSWALSLWCLFPLQSLFCLFALKWSKQQPLQVSSKILWSEHLCTGALGFLLIK